MSVNFEPEMMVIPEGEFLMGCETRAQRTNARRIAFGWTASPSGARLLPTGCIAFFWKGQDDKLRHPDQPVTSVSWFDAARLARWLVAASDQDCPR